MTDIEAAKHQLSQLSKEIFAAVEKGDWDVVVQRQSFRLQRVKHFLNHAIKDHAPDVIAGWIDEIRAEDERIKAAVETARRDVQQKMVAAKQQKSAVNKYKSAERQKD